MVNFFALLAFSGLIAAQVLAVVFACQYRAVQITRDAGPRGIALIHRAA